jgi:hypothetical protein
MTRRDPFTLFNFEDAITRRESEAWVERSFGRLSSDYDLGRSDLTAAHKRLITKAFEAGAEFEVIRLSRATTVNFHGLPAKVITDGAKLWRQTVQTKDINACSLDTWRNVLRNSFAMGSEFVRNYLFPPRPHRSPVVKKRVQRR